jgi:hypothetical protein
MAFLNTIPQPLDQESQSQAQLLNNFDAINTYLNVNHVAFNGGDQGKHKFIHFQLQAPSPTVPLATTATEYGLYNKNNILGNPALWIRPPGTVAGVAVPDLDIDITTINYTVPGSKFKGYSYLPNGMKMVWGKETIAAGTLNTTFNFPIAFSAAGQINIQLTVLTKTGSYQDNLVVVDAFTNTNFRATRVDAAHVGTASTFNYVAIGV